MSYEISQTLEKNVETGEVFLRESGEKINGVQSFDTLTDVKNSDKIKIGEFVRTLGYYTPGDGGGNDYEIVAAGTGSNYGLLYEQLTGSGFEAKLLGGGIMEDKTAYIPTDYATLQGAIDDLSKLRPIQGATIDLMIESGHSPSSFIRVEKGNYGHFLISSEDEEITTVSIDVGQESVPFLYANESVAPVMNCLIDGNSLVFRGCYYIGQSTGSINNGCGVKNVRERGLYVGTSIVTAGGCNFSGAGQDGGEFGRCLWATRVAIVNCENADFTGCAGSATSVYISRASTVHAATFNVSVLNATHSIWLHRGSTLNAQSAVVSGQVDVAMIYTTRGSTAVVNDSSIIVSGTGCGARNLNSSRIVLTSSVISVGSGNPSGALWVSSGEVDGPASISAGFGVGSWVDGGGLLRFGGSIGTVTGSAGITASNGGRAILINADLQTGASNVDVGCSDGSIVSINGATTTNSTEAGVPEVNDTSAGGRGGFNAFIGNSGVIFA